jgi:hypothetical protein
MSLSGGSRTITSGAAGGSRSGASNSSMAEVDISAIADIALRGIDREYAHTISATRASELPVGPSGLLSDYNNEDDKDYIDEAVTETEDMNVSILGSRAAVVLSSSAPTRTYERRQGTADDPLSSDDEDDNEQANIQANDMRSNFANDVGFQSFLQVNGFSSFMSAENGFVDMMTNDCTDHSSSSEENNNNANENNDVDTPDEGQSQYVALGDTLEDDEEEFTGFMSADDFQSTSVIPTGLFRGSSNSSSAKEASAESDADVTTEDNWAAFDSVDASTTLAKSKTAIPIQVSIPPLSQGTVYVYLT